MFLLLLTTVRREREITEGGTLAKQQLSCGISRKNLFVFSQDGRGGSSDNKFRSSLIRYLAEQNNCKLVD